jgi:antitoxin PrlF
MISKVTAKGQVTLPVKARQRLGIRPGTKLEFVVKDKDRMEVIVISENVTSLKGMLPKPKKVVSLSDMENAIRGKASKSLK